MNEAIYVMFILALILGAVHGFCGGDSNVQPSKNLFTFLFGE
jgi:hypothetical protein